MFKTRKKKRGSQRKRADSDPLVDGPGPDPPRPPQKKKTKRLRPAASAPGLSLGGDDDEGGEVVSGTFKISRKRAQRALREAERQQSPKGSERAGGSSSYSAEILQDLRQQSFQLRQAEHEPPPPAAAAATTTTAAASLLVPPGAVLVDGSESTICAEVDAGRARRGGAPEAPYGEGDAEESFFGSGETRAQARGADGDFIPLCEGSGCGRGELLSAASRSRLRRLTAAEGAEEEQAAWEAAQLRAAGAGGGPMGGSSLILPPTSSSRHAAPMVPRPFEQRGGETAEQIVRGLRGDLSEAEERLNIHRRDLNRMIANAETAETLGLAQGAKLEMASERFGTFQRFRDYINDLCGCLRAKSSMVNRVEDALHQVSSEFLIYLHSTLIQPSINPHSTLV